MKKIIISILMIVSLMLAGCGAIKLQMNTMELMQDYKFNESPDVLYAGAVKYFSHIKLPLTPTSKNSGVSTWKTVYKSQGELSQYRKVRYNVVVTTVSGKSILRIHTESVASDSSSALIGANIGGSDMTKADTQRVVAYELQVLESLNPSAAQSLKEKAANM